MSDVAATPERESWKERVAYRAYRSMEQLAMGLPESAGRRLFRRLGRLAYLALPGVRATVAANQARVLGRDAGSDLVRAATLEAFELYSRYWFDTFRIRSMSDAEFSKRFSYEGLENFDRALEGGKGCIGVLPHMGNWDAAGHWLAAMGRPIVAVAEELRPKRLSDLFVEHRQALGIRIVPLVAGTHVGQQLATLLASNHIVALVADRDLAGRGVEVEMFGASRRLPAGPALLALSTGAPLLVCPVYTTEEGWFCRVGAPLTIEPSGDRKEDVRTLTRLMASEFERAIAARPVDWHMFQPAWES